MHSASRYLQSVIGLPFNTARVTAHGLGRAEADQLNRALRLDSRAYYFSGCVTVVQALQSLSASMYTWAAVQLYYSVFYATRALLGSEGYCIFHAGRPAFSIHARAGSRAVQTKENTHKSVLRTFQNIFEGDPLLSQEIDLVKPLDWLMTLRETANYGAAHFIEPDVPQHFKAVQKHGVRKLISTYLADKTLSYAFDPDHAALAYPVAVFGRTSKAVFSLDSQLLGGEESEFLAERCKDRAGRMHSVFAMMNEA